eukprot:m51a1_g3161 hypothetical protein (213) ;mRNA; f:368365-369059
MHCRRVVVALLALSVALGCADCSWVYANHPSGTAFAGGKPIDVCAVNKAAEARAAGTIIGALGISKNHGLSSATKRNLKLAVRELADRHGSVIIVSGGNVHPKNTPYNEAHQMRKYLVGTLGVDPSVVAIDPYARHSVTNVRNIGRFALANGAQRVLLIKVHSADYAAWDRRAVDQLGYSLGSFTETDKPGDTVLYVPSRHVFRVGPDPLDP